MAGASGGCTASRARRQSGLVHRKHGGPFTGTERCFADTFSSEALGRIVHNQRGARSSSKPLRLLAARDASLRLFDSAANQSSLLVARNRPDRAPARHARCFGMDLSADRQCCRVSQIGQEFTWCKHLSLPGRFSGLECDPA